MYICICICIYAIDYTLDGSDPSDTHCDAKVCQLCLGQRAAAMDI